jgi:GNAT superfamily N-acetyltransferase
VDIRTAELSLHDRGRLAFDAAAAAGLGGEFSAFGHQGLLVLLTTAPGLGALNLVTGVTGETVSALPGVAGLFAAAGVPSWFLIGPPTGLGTQLRRQGLAPGPPRPLGLLSLPAKRGPEPFRVTEASTPEETDLFLDTLSAGYHEEGGLGRFLRTEHAAPGLRRFLAWDRDQPVAAAAFSVHGPVAVIGGAATLPQARGRGAQTALLHHRLARAAGAGARTAVVTAAPGSASARNLARAGFAMAGRTGWVYPPAQAPRVR